MRDDAVARNCEQPGHGFALATELACILPNLKEDVGEVIFLGIQPDIVGFYYPMTQPIKDAVATVYARLDGWQGNGGFAALEAAEEPAFPG